MVSMSLLLHIEYHMTGVDMSLEGTTTSIGPKLVDVALSLLSHMYPLYDLSSFDSLVSILFILMDNFREVSWIEFVTFLMILI
jgi:hypothetical protein